MTDERSTAGRAPEDDVVLAGELSGRLREAHRRVRDLDASDAVKGAVTRRLIAVTTASKHDVRRASLRLDLLLADLDAGRYAQDEDEH